MYLTKISLKVFAIQIHTLTFTLAYLDLNEIVCSLENTSLLRCLYIKVGFKILHSVLIVWKTTFPTNMTIFSSLAIILHEDVNYLHCQQLANVLLPHAGRGELFTGDLSILQSLRLLHKCSSTQIYYAICHTLFLSISPNTVSDKFSSAGNPGFCIFINPYMS